MQCLALAIDNNLMAPTFIKGDILIISPEVWTRSGDIAAVEYGNDAPVKAIMQITYTEDFIVLEAVNHKNPPIALFAEKIISELLVALFNAINDLYKLLI